MRLAPDEGASLQELSSIGKDLHSFVGTKPMSRPREATPPVESNADDLVNVLYIGSYTRSGSTVLNRLLGSLSEHLAVGETWHIWNVGFTQNQLCGCGAPFRECEFWTTVMERAFGGFDQVDVERMSALWHSVQSRWYLLFLAVPQLRPPAYRKRLKEYAEILSRLYRAINEISGCSVIVDSSKLASYAFILSEVEGLRLRGVHLIRDSRATAYSWKRKKVRPEIHWKTTYMERYSLTKTAFEWSAMHILLSYAMGRFDRRLVCRYEDLTRNPQTMLHDIGGLFDNRGGEVEWSEDGTSVELQLDHTVGGNPNRFERGSIKIRVDDEWKMKMPWYQRWYVTAATAPLLFRYGYLSCRKSD